MILLPSPVLPEEIIATHVLSYNQKKSALEQYYQQPLFHFPQGVFARLKQIDRVSRLDRYEGYYYKTTFKYDGNSNLIKQVELFSQNSQFHYPLRSASSTYSYDENGRRKSISRTTHEGRVRTRMLYDNNGYLQKFYFSGFEERIASIDSFVEHCSHALEYDQNRLSKKSFFERRQSVGYKTYQYDANGDLREIINYNTVSESSGLEKPGKFKEKEKFQFAYDALGRLEYKLESRQRQSNFIERRYRYLGEGNEFAVHSVSREGSYFHGRKNYSGLEWTTNYYVFAQYTSDKIIEVLVDSGAERIIYIWEII